MCHLCCQTETVNVKVFSFRKWLWKIGVEVGYTMSVCMNLILTKFDIVVIIAVLHTCMQFRLCSCACCNC